MRIEKKIECYILRIEKEMQFYQNYFSKIQINFWLISSLLISSLICIPILIILSSFFTELSGYYKLLTETYLYTYVINTVILFYWCYIIFICFRCWYCLPCFFLYISRIKVYYMGNNTFFCRTRIHLRLLINCFFFEYFGNLYSLLTFLFGEADYNKYMPRVDSMFGSIISISFSLFVYVYLITRVCFIYQSQNQIDAGRNMGFNKYQIFSRDFNTGCKTRNYRWPFFGCNGDNIGFWYCKFFQCANFDDCYI